MGHSKLPWKIQDRWHIVAGKEDRFVGSTGGIQDSSRDPVELAEEKEANACLIITAVNVMPIVKRILTVLSSESVGDFVYNIRERAAEDPKCPKNSWNHPRAKAWGEVCAMIGPILEKLEGIE